VYFFSISASRVVFWTAWAFFNNPFLPARSGFEAGLARFSKAFAQKSVQITIWIEHPVSLSNRLAANPPTV
jgi:hypothetical protein